MGTVLWILLFQAGISTGEIRGTVTDPSGAVLPFATVTIFSQSTGQSLFATTGETGVYQALLLKPDTYRVHAVWPGLESKSRVVSLSVGQTAVVDLELALERVGADVMVSPDSLLTEPDRSQQSNRMTGDAIRQLPIDKRSFLTYSLLMPGIADADALADANDYRPPQAAHSGLSFYGSSGRGNSVSIDGGEANDSGGGVRPTLSQDAVQEFQVNRSNYSVELGGAGGGSISIVSRSGTRTLHGSAYGFFRSDVMDAADPFAAGMEDGRLVRVKPPSKRQQYGATLGGPLIRNSTFFFGAFEGLRRRESAAIPLLTDESIFEPTHQQEALLATLPPLTSMELRESLTSSERTKSIFRVNSGVFPYNETDYKFSLRLDHAWSAADQLMFRYNTAVVDESNPNTRALLGASRAIKAGKRDSTGILSWMRVLSGTAVNQIHVQYNAGNSHMASADPFGPEININGFGYFNSDALLPSDMAWRRHQILEKRTWIRGAHQWKTGGEFLLRHNSVEAHVFTPGRFSFGALPGDVIHPALGAVSITSLQAFDLGIAQSFQQAFGNPRVASTEPFVAAYLEDRWRVSRGLTIEMGLRYEWDDQRDPLPTDANNLAPRVAFAWDVGGGHRTTVRGGFGIFYAPSNYAVAHVVNALGEAGGKRQAAQILTTIGTPGVQSSPNIYRTLVAQGVLTLPAPTQRITAEHLAQFGIVPSLDQRPPLSVLFSVSPDFASASTKQASLGIQHAWNSNYVVNANYLFAGGMGILRSRDRNLLPAPVHPDLGIRVWSLTERDPQLFRDVALVQDNVYESTGRSFYHGLTLELEARPSSWIRLNANYTLSKAIDDVVDFNSDFQANDQLDLRAERALSSFDQRHKFVGYASLDLPRDLVLTPVIRGNSGRPFNLLAGSDINEDFHSTTDRPPFAGRNTGRGPAFWIVDVRAAWHIRAGEGVKVELIGEAFNLFNRLNFRSVNNVVGLLAPPFNVKGRQDLPPGEPLAFTSAFDPRRVQLGTRLSF